MKELRFAVVGTNFISDWFSDAASLVPGVALAAVYSRKLDTGAAFAAKHGIQKVYDDFERMLADDAIDAVYIASPTFCHKEQAIRALDAGKHVLCEKMLALTGADAEEMKRAALKNGKVLLEAMRPDFDPPILSFSEALLRVGKLRRAEFTYCQYSSRYDRFLSGEVLNAFDPALKNSALADIGIYPLHLCVSLFGEPETLSAKSVFLRNGFEGMGSVLMSYGDFLASVNYSKITESILPSLVEGEAGTLLVDHVNKTSRVSFLPRGGEEILLAGKTAENNMIYEIEAFRDMVAGKLDYLPYLDTSVKTMKTVDRVIASAGIVFPA